VWLVVALTFAAVGGALAAMAMARDHFRLLDTAARMQLVAGWAARAGVAGVAVGCLIGLLPVFVRRPALHRTLCCLAVLLCLCVALIPGGRSRRSAWSRLDPAAGYAEMPVGRAAESAPNFVFVSVDTLCRNSLSLYGYDRPTSPSIDTFARGGTVFLNAISQAPATLRSMVSLMTGVYPYVFDAEFEGRGKRGPFLGSGFHTLAEQLAAYGYDTAGFVSNAHLKASNGFGQGFAHFDDTSGMYGETEAGRERSADDVIDPALAWLPGAKPPFFLWIHVMDPHHPYEPARVAPWEDAEAPRFEEFSEIYRRRSVDEYTRHLELLMEGAKTLDAGELDYLRDRYDAEIRQVDRAIDRLVRALNEHGFDDGNTVFVLAADHGEEFMEHGGLLHSRTLFDEMIRVPLILRGPGIPSGLRLREQVRLIDVPATLLALAGVPNPPIDGQTLSTALEPARLEDRPALSVRATKYISYRTPTHKLVVSFEPYDVEPLSWSPLRSLGEMSQATFARRRRNKIGLWSLADDPGERDNLLASSTDQARELYAELLEQRRRFPLRAVRSESEPGPSSEVIEKLRKLGYGY